MVTERESRVSRKGLRRLCWQVREGENQPGVNHDKQAAWDLPVKRCVPEVRLS
jgi:hypothetical protein